MIIFEIGVLLSHVPSVLIRTGLKDLSICEQMPDVYEINMYVCHNPSRESRKCEVGFSGSVMAQTLKAPADEYLLPFDFTEHNGRALFALDHFRFADDKHCMNKVCNSISAIPIEWDKKIPDYRKDREGFHRVLNELADAFEASGQ